jgi:hypothetical protein
MSIKNKRYKLLKYSIGGDILDWVIGVIPTKVKNFLKSHGDEKITSLELGRTPVEKYLTTVLNAISGNKFDELMKESGYDKFFHLYLIINDKYRIEKNQNINIIDYKKPKNEENLIVKVNKDLTINELINNAAGNTKESQKNFFREYNLFTNNCQDFLLKILSSNGLGNSETTKFIKQNTEKLLEGLDKKITSGAGHLTDVASGIDRAVQWLSGGKLSFETGGELKFSTSRRFIPNKRRLRKGIH